MELDGPIIEGRLVGRDNRFRATVVIEGQSTKAYVPNSGRLGELLAPDRRIFLMYRPASHRTTHYDLVMVQHNDVLVSIDSRLPGRLFHESVTANVLNDFVGYDKIKPEVAFGKSRLDFLLEKGNARRYVEVKSVTLVESGCALFPDAPTTRGTRHLHELISAKKQGHQADVVFVIQRNDANYFSPHPTADSAFNQALRAAVNAGVGVHAYTCTITLKTAMLAQAIPTIITTV